MKKNVTTGLVFILAVFLLILSLLPCCSEISIFTLMENEQEGEFSLIQEEVNIQEGRSFTLNGQGGFTPYTYTLAQGDGTLDPLSGEYTAPPVGSGDYLTAEVEASDRLDQRDTVNIRVYKALTADPTMFYITAGGTNEITINGGFGELTASAERGIAEVTGTSPPYTCSYTAPGLEGEDYIEVSDSLHNSISISVDVMSNSALAIVPSYAVLPPDGVSTAEFTVSGGSGVFSSYIVDLLPDPQEGSFSWNDSSQEITYTAPLEETAEILSVEDTDGTVVTADIYVQSEIVEELVMSPSYIKVAPGTVVEMTASGGIPPYEFTILSGAGYLEKISPTTARLETLRRGRRLNPPG